MNVGRLTLKAASAMGLRLRIICTICGRVSVYAAVTIARDRSDERRLGELRLTCSGCGHQDVEIVEDLPDVLTPVTGKGLPFTIEEWEPNDRNIIELIVATRNIAVARAAFEILVAEYPTKRILLRHGCHLLKTHEGDKRPAGPERG